MPVNPPAEYYLAEQKFNSAKSKPEKIAALEEMISVLPMHHGSEQMHAQLKSKLSKLKKESVKKSGRKKHGIQKEGDAQVCIIGATNSGKSTLLKKITDANPQIAGYEYTTTKPEIGTMDYKGIKIQVIEIPATLDSEYLSIAKTSDLIVLMKSGKLKDVKNVLKNHFVKTKKIEIDAEDDVKERIWKMLNLMVVYTKKTRTPMALGKKSNVKDFANRIHKDFVENFRFARLWRKGMIRQVGLKYILQDGDMVEIHT